MVLTGEVGTGKTTLSRYLIKKLPKKVQVAAIWNPAQSLDDLLLNIAAELKVDMSALAGAGRFQITEAIAAVLHHNHQHHHKTLLIFEEAQDLSLEALEALRLLTNIETDTCKLVHILLIGQPELSVVLSRSDLRQLNQRVIARYHLRPLTHIETTNYVIHRLSHAGGQSTIFAEKAMKVLFEMSGGIPRLINLIADRSLQLLHDRTQKQASPALVREAARLLQGANTLSDSRGASSAALPWSIAVALAVVVPLALGGGWWLWQQHLAAGEVQVVADADPVTTAAGAINQETSNQGTANQESSVGDVTPAVDLDAAMLAVWGITAIPGQELCEQASARQLRCLTIADISLTQLARTSYPALVQIQGRQVLVLGREGVQWQVLSADGPGQLLDAELQQYWDGSATFLWQPPPGFMRDLEAGDKSIPTVFWLQDALNSLGRVDGKIITGGVYTQLLVDKVAELQREQGIPADGTLNPLTIMVINRLLGHVPSEVGT